MLNYPGKGRKTWIALVIIGFLLFTGSGFRRRVDVSFLQKIYQKRTLCVSPDGTTYKLPPGYGGNSVPVLARRKGEKQFKEIGEVKAALTYSAWGGSIFSDRRGFLYVAYSGSSLVPKTQKELGKRFQAVFFSSSRDRGKTWSTPRIINGKESAGYDPRIFVDSRSTIYVAWVKSRLNGMIFLACSRNMGKSWEGPWDIRRGDNIQFSEGDDGTVFLSYVGGERSNILFVSYTRDAGKSWETVATGELVILPKEPFATSRKGTFYLVFKGLIPSLDSLSPGSRPSYQLYYITSRDKGKTWAEMKKLGRQ
ncbi:MAG: exo-alpha-sialidase [Caldiserica bacterium]|nr:exo-alpha-sialidase [Caldisericota bacterium]